MRSLTGKITLGFVVVGLIAVALVAILARLATVREFDRFLLDQALDDFLGDARAYYESHGSWAGFGEQLRAQDPAASVPGPNGEPPAMPPPPRFLLVDAGRRVVIPAGGYVVGERVPDSQLVRGVPIEIGGRAVGTVVATGVQPDPDPGELRYRERTNQALLLAGLGATGMAVLLGALLARRLTRPLRQLTAATQAMASGKLEQQVPIGSEDELGQLSASFNRMSADLARASETRRQMTADIAHELRTPLTVIAGYLESLRDGVLDPDQAQFEVMYDEAMHLQRVVEDLRTLSLADAGELALNLEPLAPRALLQRAVAAYGHQAEQRQVALSVEAPPDLPPIRADGERMAQVLGNLLSNALKHTPDGGQITLAAQRQAGSVVLSVRDSGTGIAPEALPRIFDRFYRGDEGRQAQEGQSGLGLAIAKSIVELHGGQIAARSTLGEGTTLTVSLPVGG
jgi:signal transduction histidine kinase